MADGYETQGPPGIPKQFVLCFDGTGNKFAGDESDSNVLKIFRMLDRSKSHQYHYYQPGIGTYVTSKSLTSHGRIQRIKSAYQKAKDSAVGSSFDEHVMGGYKFLMRYYSPGDDIFFIGFSRGSYIARFLAEMLDYIGLLEAGNEELVRFAWKTFAKWQQRSNDSEEEREEKKKLFTYMKAFRETFSRPISRIRFMGLFDTVNSVPRFESAWMQRTKFPYTARSSAKVIRHAVGIDERRAKFRQDLISGARPKEKKKHRRHHLQMPKNHLHLFHQDNKEKPHEEVPDTVPAIRVNDKPEEEQQEEENAEAELNASRYGPSTGETYYHAGHHASHTGSQQTSRAGSENGTTQPDTYRARSPRRRLVVPKASTDDLRSLRSKESFHSLHSNTLSVQIPVLEVDSSDDEDDQDIHEVWFPGCHADIGGGWTLSSGESWALSHAPLVWMTQEAQKAGLELDERKMKQFQCLEEFDDDYSSIREEINSQRPGRCVAPDTDNDDAFRSMPDDKERSVASRDFWHALYTASTKGLMHDCLMFNQGIPTMSVITWRIMEWLPFRRMDLQPDGSWKPISWPLPRGEVRDVPLNAEIHVSAIRRMQADPKYRPGNVIVGGGGRGIRVAPEEYGIGEWVVFKHEGDLVRETYVRKNISKCKEG
ncbi:hypothetical protein CBS147339_5694 [Penicillium roqueforti]|uniref:T6SS Phospholipase effector Tle1-like catalytic domain-containing protein n=1 Tax=Penicillium roqueforti (strain FM164) TaxID=1365484 RepID=W6QBA7_PENRF|nr:uncharacterized protein LCP9604111_2677 [Penicillium roqueforti]CDM33983.1 Domain of unknown function DUF2235 [Penicillium roqueforti FM164]KAF9251276.1 hypothetical protein LCP9604111_2677 [Penicillium roqueforti]KAI3075143.1 hypothetical protein CBS147339_5694 [Penicillium roqueforti]KAI3104420.1 hypothetical protein CBS147338_1617 [Penicillium roqueforti]KAI3137500.1 hypothetical protein CBS147325_7205 [Penicillium roqueforti]